MTSYGSLVGPQSVHALLGSLLSRVLIECFVTRATRQKHLGRGNVVHLKTFAASVFCFPPAAFAPRAALLNDLPALLQVSGRVPVFAPARVDRASVLWAGILPVD